MLNGLIQSRNTTEEKRSTKSTPNNQKVAIRTYISIITVNVNGLNAPTKRPRLAEWIGEGNGTPLQYSCLENPMDGGAW